MILEQVHSNVSGQFTLRDMYEQFQNIMKMGPFSQIMVSELVVLTRLDDDDGLIQ